MFAFRWMRPLLGGTRSRKERRRFSTPRRKPIRPILEAMEERLTPSGGNPTVTQTAGGYTALTSAITSDTAAHTNYIIQITGNFVFNSGSEASISKLGSDSTLTIEGQNGKNYTLTGNGNRLFTIASGQNVTLADLTLTGGSVTNTNGNAVGGAVQIVGGNVTLSKLNVQGNKVEGSAALGGGVYVSGASTVAIRDSILSDNLAQGAQGANSVALGTDYGKGNSARGGGAGGSAYGGGLYVVGGSWTVTLIGDTLSGNTAAGGMAGTGAAGKNSTSAITSGGNGGYGGRGGNAAGGAAYITGSGRLTILNDFAAPIAHPSVMIDNSALAGTGGTGGAGGDSTGTTHDSYGGGGGTPGEAFGGALVVEDGLGNSLTANIGNSSFYGNKAVGGKLGTRGAPGTGGIPNEQPLIVPQPGGDAYGGGLQLEVGTGAVTLVNSTVAANTVLGGAGTSGGQGHAAGGGIEDDDEYDGNAATILENNTITQNTVSGGSNYLPPPPAYGSGTVILSNIAGVFVSYDYRDLTFRNNLIQGNQSSTAPALDLDSDVPLSNAGNNFIGTMNANAVNNATNIVGNSQVQLGNVVGIDSSGKPTGGPIYYPILSGAVSIGAGSTSVLNTIAAVEGTTAANATDEIGNLLSTNGAIDLGAVQIPTPPPPSPPAPVSPSPSPLPVLSSMRLIEAIVLDVDALIFQDFPPIVSFLDGISQQLLGQPLPSPADLVPTIGGDIAALVNAFLNSKPAD